jgi:hypothetical protein
MAEQEKVYRYLNPVGISLPVETFPLAPRLDSLEGKTIFLSVTGEPDITIALEKSLRTEFPQVNWKTKKTYTITPVEMSEDELKTCDGLIQAVCW